MPRKSSRNKKRGWKATDITEVQDFLEDERLQERTGGLVAEKADSQLFFIDTVQESGSSKLPNVARSKKEAPVLKCYSNLEPDPRIPAIAKSVRGGTSKRKNRVTKLAPRKLLSALEQRQQALKQAATRKNKQSQIHQEDYDLWAENDGANSIDDHFATVTKKKRVKTPKQFHSKPSAVSAVEAPHPGSSYNPAFDDHQELLRNVISKQVKDDEIENRIIKKVTPKYNQHGGRPTKESLLMEMSEGLGLVDSDKDSDDHLSNEEDDCLDTKAVKTKIKTKKQRRKQELAKQQAQARIKEKKEKQREDRNRIDKLRSIKKDIRLKEKVKAQKAVAKAAKKEALAYTTKRLRKDKFEEPDPAVLLSSELTGSLRSTKCPSTLLEDRYKSLQKRNILEPRAKNRHTYRRKVRHVEKREFREITLSSRAGGGIVIPHLKRKHDET